MNISASQYSLGRTLSVPLLLFTLAGALGDEPKLEQSSLFEAETEGYALYRIPGIIVTAKGTVLVYCEARKDSARDWGHIDVVYRRSTDGGQTFSPAKPLVQMDAAKWKLKRNPAAVAQKLGREGALTFNNPLMIADRDGSVHLLYCVEYNRLFYCRSTDDGASFGEPAEITAVLDKFRRTGVPPAAKERAGEAPAPRGLYPWQAMAVGPGHGIQLASKRLLVPAWISRATGGGAHRPSAITTIYSDDGGRSWHAGEIIAGETDPLINPSEHMAVELSDGRVMVNIRSESKPNRRAYAISSDGATRWSSPEFHDALMEPICMASLIRLPLADGTIGLLFSNPYNLDAADVAKQSPGRGRDRKNLSLQLSRDDGRSWPVRKTLEPGASGYSDLAVLPDGTILCFYERGSSDGKMKLRYLTLARLNEAWLTAE
jgi:sialidase-1